MDDRTAATAGFVVAGLSFAATLAPWPGGRWTVAVAVAAVAAVAFALRRHGYLDRRVGAPLAGLASAGLLVVALVAIVRAADGPGAGLVAGPGSTALGGTLAASMAYADWHAVGRDGLASKARAAAAAAAVGLSGLLAIVVWGVVIGSLVPRGPDGGIDPSLGSVLSAAALGLGTATVAALYLRATDRDLGFIDAALPDRRGLGYVAGGVVLMVGLNLGIGVALQELGVESATHSVMREARTTPEILLAFIPLSYVFVGPGEELLYRNVVQKSLYGTFSARGAVVVASAIFAGVHVFAYSDPSTGPAGTLTTLLVLFVLALVLGVVYDRTRNVVVSALVHGSFNAVAFAVTYAQFTGAFG